MAKMLSQASGSGKKPKKAGPISVSAQSEDPNNPDVWVIRSSTGEVLALQPKNPKRLSKAGEWMRAHPNGLEGTYDKRAVMR